MMSNYVVGLVSESESPEGEHFKAVFPEDEKFDEFATHCDFAAAPQGRGVR